MPIDLTETLVIGISATALFDLSEADKIFKQKNETDPDTAIDEYRTYMLEHENEPLEDGTAMPLVRSLLNLNSHKNPKDNAPIVEVVVISRNSPAEMRVIKTLRSWNVYIDQAFFLGGLEKSRFLKAFKPHIFFDDQDSHLDPASGEVPSAKVLYPSNSLLNKIMQDKACKTESTKIKNQNFNQ
ncbi:5'-nucleotidase [Shewanella insulae]|uniref:5'-nucleotidase n=1 Tax=Shewanella insulae TaxID=2681496 RepID=UPI001EFD917B|nr:5'-nucleotidase [Shewanella insulae]MCG9713682.1 5'-nucleotidase [Shewanella insulae]